MYIARILGLYEINSEIGKLYTRRFLFIKKKKKTPETLQK